MVVTIDRQNQYEQVNKFVVTVDIIDHVSYRFHFVRSCVLVLYVNCYNLSCILTLSILSYLNLAGVGFHKGNRFNRATVTAT